MEKPITYKCELTLNEIVAICKALAPPMYNSSTGTLNPYKRNKEWKEKFPNIFKMHEVRRELIFLKTLEQDVNQLPLLSPQEKTFWEREWLGEI